MAKQKETKDTDLSMQLEHFVSSGKIKKAKLKYDVGDRNGCILAAARLASESGEDYYVFATGLRWKATPTSVGTSKNTIKAQGGLRITPQGEVFVIEHPFKSQASTETTALSIPKPKGNWNTGPFSHWSRYKTVLEHYAEKFGYKEVGSGCSGFVLYRIDDPFFLIKVFHDRAYRTYVDLCSTKLKGNPYVPVFKGKPVKINKDGVLGIRVEKLTRVDPNKIGLASTLQNYFDSKLWDKKNIAGPKDKARIEKFEKRFANDASIKAVIDALLKYLVTRKNYKLFYNDFSHNNLMQRGKQLVFIDPLSAAEYFDFIKFGKSKAKDTEVASLIEARMPAIEGNSWKKAMRKIAEDHGLKWMGSGAFGSVFSIPSNPEYVLKVFSDRSYLRWVQLCQTSLRGNKYAPQFKGKPVKLYPDRNLWGIRIKRLLPIDKIRTNGTDFVDDLRFYLVYLVTHSLQLDSDYFNRKDVDSKFKHVSDKYEDDEDFWDLTSTLSFYLTLGENYKHFTLDLHYNNVMVDPNTKGYVVVDPLAQSESLAKPFRFKYGKPDVPDTEVPSSMNLRIEDVNSLLLKKGYRVENGSPDEIVYTKSKVGKRRSIRVALKNKVVTDITVELHTPNPNDPWNPTVVKRKVNLEGIKNEAGTTN